MTSTKISEIKRKIDSNPDDKKQMKKLCHEEIISISSIENLSNEIFYEIFDYLDGCLIYSALSNLNHRFHQLLNSSSVLFKIKFDSKSIKLYKNFSKQLTLLNKHQIYSLNFYLPLQNNSSFIIDSSFYHLECLTLNQLKPDLLLSVLSNLSNLPRLSSLTIDAFDILKYSTNIYRIVFSLPLLKYFKFSANNSNLFISLPIPADQQYSPIKYLVINHCCTFHELSMIVSYTPQLCYLDYMNININQYQSNVGIILPITLPNLTRLFLCMYEIKYEEFEIFISKIDAKLKFFSLTTLSEDVLYFDAARWKEILVKYLPELKEFCFQYHEYNVYDYKSATHLGELNQFISPFWMDRQWGFEVKTELQYIVYSVCPYEKQWYEYNTQFYTQVLKATRLTLTDIPSLDHQHLIIDYIDRALTVAQYYHLEIPHKEIFNGVLIQIVDLLPELLTLKIHSLSFEEPRDLCEEEVNILLSREDTSIITKVYLEIMMEITDIYFLMVLCPHMEYLKVGFIDNMDVELFVRKMLHKINFEDNPYLRLLCVRVAAADDELIQKLENMIYVEKLIVDYSIKRVSDKIYLQWK